MDDARGNIDPARSLSIAPGRAPEYTPIKMNPGFSRLFGLALGSQISARLAPAMSPSATGRTRQQPYDHCDVAHQAIVSPAMSNKKTTRGRAGRQINTTAAVSDVHHKLPTHLFSGRKNPCAAARQRRRRLLIRA
jgi:hypothetical protein